MILIILDSRTCLKTNSFEYFGGDKYSLDHQRAPIPPNRRKFDDREIRWVSNNFNLTFIKGNLVCPTILISN